MENEELERNDTGKSNDFNEEALASIRSDHDDRIVRNQASDLQTRNSANEADDGPLQAHELSEINQELNPQESEENNVKEGEKSPQPHEKGKFSGEIKVHEGEARIKIHKNSLEIKSKEIKKPGNSENALKFLGTSQELKSTPEKPLKEIFFNEDMEKIESEGKSPNFFEDPEQFESIFKSEVKKSVNSK
jgi:hypothetical protein